MRKNHTTLKEFRARCAPSVKVLEYESLYTPCTWQCRLCKEVYTYNSAAEVYRRQYPCKCTLLADKQAECPEDVELLEYHGNTKKCVFRCTRCNTIHRHKTFLGLIPRSSEYKANCYCDGWKIATKLPEFLESIKHLPYKPLDYERSSKKCNFECLACGRVFEAVPGVLARGKHRCPACKRSDITGQYVRRLHEAFPHITLVGKYHAKRASRYRCTCGYEWDSKPFVSKNRVQKVGCPKCDYKAGGPKLRSIQAGGREVAVQGFEDIALDYLEQKGIDLSELAVRKEEGVPTIQYRWRKVDRFYWPDFYYQRTNTIYEVKSIFTLLSLDYPKTCAKAKACLKQGYKFKLILVHGGKKDGYILKLPKGWYSLPQTVVVEYLRDRYPELAHRISTIAKDNPFVDSKRAR